MEGDGEHEAVNGLDVGQDGKDRVAYESPRRAGNSCLVYTEVETEPRPDCRSTGEGTSVVSSARG